MKTTLYLSIFITLGVLTINSQAQDLETLNQNRIFEKDVQSVCTKILPTEANVGDHSICKNAFGACMVQHIKNRNEAVSENIALTFVEQCAEEQFTAAQQYAEWRGKSGVSAKWNKYISGVISFEEMSKDEIMKMDAECRLSSKMEGYTNYVKMLDCVKSEKHEGEFGIKETENKK